MVFEFYRPNSYSWIRPDFIFSKNLFSSVYRDCTVPCTFSQGFIVSRCRIWNTWKADRKDVLVCILFGSKKRKKCQDICSVDISNKWYNQSYCWYWGWRAGRIGSHGPLGFKERSRCSWSTTLPYNYRGAKAATTSAAKELTSCQQFLLAIKIWLIDVGNLLRFRSQAGFRRLLPIWQLTVAVVAKWAINDSNIISSA